MWYEKQWYIKKDSPSYKEQYCRLVMNTRTVRQRSNDFPLYTTIKNINMIYLKLLPHLSEANQYTVWPYLTWWGHFTTLSVSALLGNACKITDGVDSGASRQMAKCQIFFSLLTCEQHHFLQRVHTYLYVCLNTPCKDMKCADNSVAWNVFCNIHLVFH